MSLNKPSDSEDEYFAREEAARQQRAALENAKKTADADREARKKLHFMKCPKCGYDLQEQVFKGVTIDKCYSCGYVGFDDKELDAVLGHENPNLVSSIVNIFRHKK
ncbi:MAG TPA: zf-TFIIB domain-containing protein [Pseudomonadota bacterium]|jgi:hypothetical protein|nr:zf-TFIIB domain-containing protein [Deltaproteobacteria bacterium]HPH28253.1 zf-TFIIB domain-containing protein [Pseudomonadota bacterium]